VIIFCLVRFLSKKVTKLKLFFFEKKTKTEPKPGQTDRFRFGSVRFFRAKIGSNRFGSVFPVLARFSRFWLGFFGLARFFRFGSVFFWFFVGFGSVRFFRFFAYKTETEPNRTSRVFQKFNRFNWFFFSVRFFQLFFSGFLGLIGFSVFCSPLVEIRRGSLNLN